MHCIIFCLFNTACKSVLQYLRKFRQQFLCRDLSSLEHFVKLGGCHTHCLSSQAKSAGQPLAKLASQLLGLNFAFGHHLFDSLQRARCLIRAQTKNS